LPLRKERGFGRAPCPNMPIRVNSRNPCRRRHRQHLRQPQSGHAPGWNQQQFFGDRSRRRRVEQLVDVSGGWHGFNSGQQQFHDRRAEYGGVRACLKIPRGSVFGQKAGWQGATKEDILGGSSTEEQRSQTAFCPQTLRAAGLLPVAGVGSFLTARFGDARNSPSWPPPKSLVAGPLGIFRQALRSLRTGNCRKGGRVRWRECPCVNGE
jgi:hypothetical protein